MTEVSLSLSLYIYIYIQDPFSGSMLLGRVQDLVWARFSCKTPAVERGLADVFQILPESCLAAWLLADLLLLQRNGIDSKTLALRTVTCHISG